MYLGICKRMSLSMYFFFNSSMLSLLSWSPIDDIEVVSIPFCRSNLKAAGKDILGGLCL